MADGFVGFVRGVFLIKTASDDDPAAAVAVVELVPTSSAK